MSEAGMRIDELTELYFSLEDASERDAFLDLLTPLRHPEVDAFLRAMLEHDADTCMRGAAARLLIERGDPAGWAYVEAQLAQPEDEAAFVEAVGLTVRQRGAAAFAPLAAIWADPGRSPALRREALWGMERADRGRCAQILLDWCAAQPQDGGPREDLLEAVLLCLGRLRVSAAAPALHALAARLPAPPLQDLLRQGLALLR